MAGNAKPILLFCSTPIHGHVMPVRGVARNLVARGYGVIFLTGNEFRSKVEEIGATFSPLLGKADFSLKNINSPFPNQDKDASPSRPYRLSHSMKYLFANTIPDQHESVQGVLQDIKIRYPDRKVIIVQEYTFWGTLPIMVGASGLKPAAFISLGISPMTLRGPGIPPFGLGLSYDASPAGLANSEELYKHRDELFLELTDALGDVFKDLGLEPLRQSVMDLQVLLPDRYLQMCIPSLEYPHAVPPPGLRFTGGLPHGHRRITWEKPPWWDDVAVSVSKRRIVAVSQGTATTMFDKLIIPTLRGLADCDNVLVVAALGREGAALPEDIMIPDNSRVADYIPFDDLLPYADVFVTNGGYGGFQHAVSHGVPLIVAGLAADKPEVAARVEWAGLGINMRTEMPNEDDIREAVLKVLNDRSFKERAVELESEIQQYNIFDIVEENVKELAKRDS